MTRTVSPELEVVRNKKADEYFQAVKGMLDRLKSQPGLLRGKLKPATRTTPRLILSQGRGDLELRDHEVPGFLVRLDVRGRIFLCFSLRDSFRFSLGFKGILSGFLLLL